MIESGISKVIHGKAHYSVTYYKGKDVSLELNLSYHFTFSMIFIILVAFGTHTAH